MQGCKRGTDMKGLSFVLGASAIVAASWAVPAQATQTVMLYDGMALVCNTAWVNVCFRCYGPTITDSGGWECFAAIALKPTSLEQKTQKERRNGWDIETAPKGSKADVRRQQTAYSTDQASKSPSSPDAAIVEAVLKKLFPAQNN